MVRSAEVNERTAEKGKRVEWWRRRRRGNGGEETKKDGHRDK